MDTPRNGEAQNKKKRPRPSITPKPENGVPSEYFLSANATHTVGVGITGPPPPFSRVLVRRFAEVNRLIDSEITRHLALCTQPYQDVDLDVSELRYRSPETAIAESIEEASKRPEFEDLGTQEFIELVEIPDYEKLVEQESSAHLMAIEHIKFVRSAISKVRSKHVNYLAKAIAEEESKPFVPIPENDVILSVALYPAHSTSKVQEYLVLSSQPLTALKDALYCIQNQNPAEASSDAPSSVKNTSGYFFIDDTFYNDTRDPMNSDYSEAIVKWIRTGQSPYWSSLDVKKASMEATKFEDLVIQVGKRYLYCHRARCEHTIVFTAIREVNPRDDRNYNSYPRLIYQAKYRQRKCTICAKAMAKWITSEDAFSVEDPSYYCSECFDMAHKSDDGTIMQTGFKLLPYLHD